MKGQRGPNNLLDISGEEAVRVVQASLEKEATPGQYDTVQSVNVPINS